jgi:hypothetical protein
VLPALHQNQAKSGPYSALGVWAVKTSLSISLCILRDLPQQKIPREFCSERDPAIFLCSHVPLERFFDGTNQKNSKTQGGKAQIRKIQKNKKERMEERKRRYF